jgi:hypothetical protein
MLSIVAVLEEFRSMLLGAEIHIHTDHKKITFNKDIKTQFVLRWHTKIEEFPPFVHYIEGEKNILADQLSRLEIFPSPAQLAKGKKLVEPAEVTDDEDEDESYFLEKEFSGLYDQTIWDILECYLSLPETEQLENNPLSYPYIREKQQEDDALLALLNKYPNNYVYLKLDDETEPIICYKKYPDKDDWNIALPNSIVPEVVKWLDILDTGQTRLQITRYTTS